MNLKKASFAVAVLGLVTGAACSSGSTSTAAGTVASSSTTTAAVPLKWTPEGKAGVRSLMAMTAQGDQLNCAVDVTTSVYSPEDWTYLMAHMSDKDEPQRLKDLDDQAAKELETRCGIKDTRADQKAKSDALDAYNAAVDEWNQLTVARDAAHQANVVVNGKTFETYKDWAQANGKPLSPPS